MSTTSLLLLPLAFVPMVLEARVSRRNEQALRAMGATEPDGDVYRAMQVVYPACFLAIIVEAWLRPHAAGLVTAAGGALFVASKALKYWAIASLGVRWSFRVLVPPRSAVLVRGPYQFVRHPNYVAVLGELAGMALMAQAPATGTVALVVFGALMAARVRVEERALGMR